MTPTNPAKFLSQQASNRLVVKDEKKGLYVLIERGFLETSTTSSCSQQQDWYQTIIDNSRWYRVKYKSQRFGKECETPCWTCFYGGRKEYKPYTPVPSWLQPLVDKISSHLGQEGGKVPFNAMLLRLYFDGTDEIAWHTDGRTFLGDTPTIASLSLGAKATFQMRRMHNVWPSVDGNGGGCCSSSVDTSTPQHDFVLGDGDLLVMKGMTQKYWHHRVPKQKGRKPRLNINFRYILQGPDAERGQKTYYKYMVHGDDSNPPSYTYQEIVNQRGGIMKFATATINQVSSNKSQSLYHKQSCKIEDPDHRAVVQGEHEKENSDIENDDPGKQQEEFSIAPGIKTECSRKTDNEGLDNLAKGYLESETDVDVATFLALPCSLQKELVNEWDQTRTQQQQQNSSSDRRTTLLTNNRTSITSASKRPNTNNSMTKNKKNHRLGNQRKKTRSKDASSKQTIESFFSQKQV